MGAATLPVLRRSNDSAIPATAVMQQWRISKASLPVMVLLPFDCGPGFQLWTWVPARVIERRK